MPGPRNAKRKKRVQLQKGKDRRQITHPLHVEAASEAAQIIAEVEQERVYYRPLPSQPLRYTTNYFKDTINIPTEPYDTQPNRIHELITPLSTCTITQPDSSVYYGVPSNEAVARATPKHRDDWTGQERVPDDIAIPLKQPCIQDTGDGLHVYDVLEFVFESRFASPPSLDDAMCAEFSQEEVLDMLCTVLPEETAAILWYNKSRLKARICPACKRLYRVGEPIRGLGSSDSDSEDFDATPKSTSTSAIRRHREQEISGLCSSLCFFLAAHQYPTALRSMWGRMAEELDDEMWKEINLDSLRSSTRLSVNADHDLGLGMLLKMTRCHDLGLQQIFFPEQDLAELHDGQGDYYSD